VVRHGRGHHLVGVAHGLVLNRARPRARPGLTLGAHGTLQADAVFLTAYLMGSARKTGITRLVLSWYS
jgi:hypothetical protein